MLDIMESNKSLKIAWTLKYISDECKSKWKCFLISIFLNWGTNYFFLGTLSKKDATKLNVKDNFLQELIEIWADFNYKDSFDSQRDFSGSLIWNNSLVGIVGEAVFCKNWAKAGVKISKIS